MRPRNRLYNSSLGLWDLCSLWGKKKDGKMFPYFIFSLRYSHILNKVMIFRNRDKDSKCMCSSLQHSLYKHKNAPVLYVSSLPFVGSATVLEWTLIKKKKKRIFIWCHLFTENPTSNIFSVLMKIRLFFTPDWAARFQELLRIRGLEEAIITSENDSKSLIYVRKGIAI